MFIAAVADDAKRVVPAVWTQTQEDRFLLLSTAVNRKFYQLKRPDIPAFLPANSRKCIGHIGLSQHVERFFVSAGTNLWNVGF